ncbi:hypothetical protein AJ80_03614 [Polytolypa hystricis UAMH7299]|uniref:CENP-V/GFA domain-containing protein n=1 Tax=Polytolypa hystricis (strain UAMH7299) TaxID=1447883 RepID=A0A2B7YFP3_POLH7|nr:hypothetical protein AJ80_03614 [Polytolypa hystricis UAMH7299]
MTTPIVLRGGCACAHIRYTSTTLPTSMTNCACIQCRKASGSPYQTFASFPTPAITWDSNREPKYFKSSSFARRGFCDRCGSSLLFQMDKSPEIISLAAGSIDDWDVKELRKPDVYYWLKEKATWWDVPENEARKCEVYPEEEMEEELRLRDGVPV